MAGKDRALLMRTKMMSDGLSTVRSLGIGFALVQADKSRVSDHTLQVEYDWHFFRIVE